MARKIPIVVLLLLLSVSACNKVVFVSKKHSPGNVVHNNWVSYYLFGLVGEHDIDLSTLCPQGVYKFEVYDNVGSILVSGITLGIYTPRVVEIVCAASKKTVQQKYRIGLTKEGKPLFVSAQDEKGEWKVIWAPQNQLFAR